MRLAAIGLLASVAACRPSPSAAQLPDRALPPPAPVADAKRPARQRAELRATIRVTLGAAPAAQASLAGSTAYVPMRDGRVVAVDLETASIRWSVTLSTTLPPVAGGGLVFVAGDDMLTALGPDSHVVWQLPVAGGFSAAPVWAGGWLLVGTAGGDVLCMRAGDGHVLWTRQIGSRLQPGAAVSGDRVYLGLEDGTVAAHALQTGEPVWQHKLGGTPGPILALADRLFVGSRDKFFYCLDTADGDRRWRWRTGGVIAGPAVVDDARVYFTALDNVLRALDLKGGSQRWKAGLPLRPSGGPLLIGTLVAVAGVAAEIRTYDTSDGKEVGHYEAPADLAAPPLVLPGPIPELSAVLLLTRGGEVQLLRRLLEPGLVPLDYRLGAPVPLDLPPPLPPTP